MRNQAQDEERVAAPRERDNPAAAEFDAGRVARGQSLGHYRIGERLGAGGMGEVWEAQDETLKRIVALKLLPKELAGDRVRFERLRREAETLATLDHPNIVIVHSFEETDGVRFITMERVDGKRLSDMIPKGGLGLDLLFDIAVPLADALAAAHDRGVVHRDLKSANIMITTDGRVKVLDFGLAKVQCQVAAGEDTNLSTETLTRADRFVGTVPYMSPEQLVGKQADACSDLFSLGVILYEMATGRRPFQGDSSATLISSILRDEPRDVDRVRQNLPHHLGRIIRQCLVKDPEHRYQAAKDVRNELEALREEVHSAERATDPLHRTRPGPLLPLAAVLAIAVVGLGLGFYALWQQQVPGEGTAQSAAAVGQSDCVRIVVLSFENLGQVEDEYFADGMTAEIVSRLAGVQGIGVISLISAMQYKGTRPSLATLAADLDVDYVLDGSVRWERDDDGPDRIRITAHLTQVADSSQLWSGRYDSESTEVLDMQSQIAEKVIRELQVVITEPTLAALRARPTDDLEAYDAYLRGLELKRYPTYSEEQTALAEKMFARAIDLDPGFALAYAELAGVHALLYFNTDRTESRLAAASAAVARALDLAPEQPAVHLAAANYYYRARGDYERALEEYSIALAGLPGNAEVLAGMGFVRRRQGEWNEALEMLSRAFELDPRSAQLAISLADTLSATRDHEGAGPYIDKAIALAPDQAEFWGTKADNIFALTGDVEAARRILDEVAVPEDPLLLSFEAQLDLYAGDYAAVLSRLTSEKIASVEAVEGAKLNLMAALADQRTGAHQVARERLESNRGVLIAAVARAPQDPFPHAVLAQNYALLGRRQEALEHGRLAVELLADDAYSGPRLLESLATVHALLGDVEEAVKLLQRLQAISYREPVGVHQLELNPAWDSLRDNPGFQKLLEWHVSTVLAAPAREFTDRGEQSYVHS